MEDINPNMIYDTLKRKYLSFLLTTICRNNKGLHNELEEVYTNNKIVWTDLFVQKAPKYKHANESLISNLKFSTPIFDLIDKFKLQKQDPYIHQIQAWETILSGKNCVIATGTGSGKTEAFILPVIDNCIVNDHNGVQTVIIYPLKALANDQGKRIGKLLDDINTSTNKHLTYGIFDGDTGKRESSGARSELNSKDEMINNPPNILLTNYVMLERIVLDPDYKKLFRNNHIRYIVLDEVHYYRGAQGIDVALLMRRLQFHLQKDEKHKITYIGTSATISSKEDSTVETKEFLFKLFNKHFETDEIIKPTFDEAYQKDQLSKPTSLSLIKGKIDMSNLRAHAFFCSPNSVYRCLECNSLNLTDETCSKCNSKLLFEIMTCRQCGHEYFNYDLLKPSSGLSEIRFRDLKDILTSIKHIYSTDLPNCESEEIILCKDETSKESLKFCKNCLSIYSNNKTHCPDCEKSEFIKVYPVEDEGDTSIDLNKKKNDKYCPFCKFDERIKSLIVSASKLSDENCSHIIFDELFMSLPENRRKLLLFTDNVQRTSKFARELEETHVKNIARAYLHRIISGLNGPINLSKLIYDIMAHINQYITLSEEQEHNLQEELYEELLSTGRKVASLANRGIFRLELSDINIFDENHKQKILDTFEVFKEERHVLSYYRTVIKDEFSRNDFLENDKLYEKIYRRLYNLKGKRIKEADLGEIKYIISLLKEKGFVDEFEGKYFLKDNFIYIYKNKDISPEDKNYYDEWNDLINIPFIKTKIDTGKTNAEERSKLEADFKQNKSSVNILVATPTLELGIDIGDLDVIGLLYAPPSAAQYNQRVGRSGRNGQSSFSVTFLAKRTLDAMYFNKPEDLVSGEIKPPLFDINLEIPIKKSLFSLFFYYVLNHTRFCNERYGSEWKKVQNWEQNFETMKTYLITYKNSFIEFLKPYLNILNKQVENENLIEEWIKKLEDHILLRRSIRNSNFDMNQDIFNYFQEAGLLPDYAFGSSGTFVLIPNIAPIKGFSLNEVCPPSTLDFNKSRYSCEKISFLSNHIKKISDGYRFCENCKEIINLVNTAETCNLCGSPMQYESEELLDPKVIRARRSTFSLTQKRVNWSNKLIDMPLNIDKINKIITKPFLCDIGSFFENVTVNNEIRDHFICSCGEVYDYKKARGKDHSHTKRNSKIASKFKTQVMLLDFSAYPLDSRISETTMLNAIISAATLEAGCEDGEISGFVLENRKTLVLFDDIEGGVGFVEILSKRFKDIIKRAKYLCESGCCSNGCIKCIGSFWRQKYLDFLNKRSILPILDEILNDVSLK